MDRRWFWFLAGAGSTFAAQRVAKALTPPAGLRVPRPAQRRPPSAPELAGTAGDRLQIGGHKVEWVLLSWADYTPGRIRGRYDAQPLALPPDLAALRDEFVRDWHRRNAAGEPGLPFNGTKYSLQRFDVSQREIRDREEVPILHLEFGPTDYFTQLVTDLNVGNPIRDRYAARVDLAERPVPEFASNIGVDLNLVTADGYLIVAEKSRRAHKGGGRLSCAVGEGFMRPTDAGPNGAPDPFRCAVRGVQEEIGAALDPSQITFTAFGVDPRICEYALIGWAELTETRAEVEALRSLGVPRDKWEARRLLYVPIDPDEVARLVVGSPDRWLAEGQAAVALSLLQGARYPWPDVAAAFARARAAARDTGCGGDR